LSANIALTGQPQISLFDEQYDLIDSTIITRVLRTLLNGQLRLREHGSLVCAVAIRHDGSGGLISWGLATSSYVQLQGGPRFSPNNDYIVSFLAKDSGRRLDLVEQAHHRTLLGLPWNALGKIHREVTEDELSFVDLDKDTCLKGGLTRVNRGMYSGHSNYFMCATFVVSMSTTEEQTTFNDSARLRALLRKRFFFSLQRYEQRGSLIEDSQVSFILNFRLDQAVPLADVSISVLPLVMETSSKRDNCEVIVRIVTSTAAGTDTVIAEARFRLHDLRVRVAKALTDVVFTSGDEHNPIIWINGLGEVTNIQTSPHVHMESNFIPDTASKVIAVPNGDMYWVIMVMEVHTKDSRYRGPDDRSSCWIKDVTQFFPFHGSPSEALRYLLCVLKQEDYNYKDKYVHLRRSGILRHVLTDMI
jgi:hypothetical protein